MLHDRTGRLENTDEAEQTAEAVKQPATSDVKKMYVREGKTIGKVKSNGKKFVVELSAPILTAEQEQELMKFLDNLLAD